MEKTLKINKRNNGIDILRGLCILAVILLHLNIHFGFTNTFLKDTIPPKLFSLLFWSGFYGVVIFFTLSGFLITLSILKKWGRLSKIDIKTFYWFRFSRIIPLLLALLMTLSILHLANIQGFTIDSEQTSLARAIFSALTFHINWLEIQVGYLPANWDILWSISIEETFYLLFPLFCLFLKKEWQLIVALSIFFIVSPWARTHLFIGNELADKNHLAFIDSIVLGCISAMVASRFTFQKWTKRTFLIVGCSMAVLVLIFRGFIYKSGLVSLGLNITILSLGIAFILLWLHQKDDNVNKKGYWFYNWFKQMGIYSYEIYLSHMFVVILGAKIFKYYKLGTNWLIPFSMLLLCTSYLLGKVLFHYFSEPLNLWLRNKWMLKNNISALKK